MIGNDSVSPTKVRAKTTLARLDRQPYTAVGNIGDTINTPLPSLRSSLSRQRERGGERVSSVNRRNVV